MNATVKPAAAPSGPATTPIPPTTPHGAKILLMGGTGTGKTHSLRTLVNAGLEVFILFSENGMASLRDTDPEKVHWHYIPPAPTDLNALITMSKNLNLMTQQQLANLTDPNKRQHMQYVEMLQTMANFKCDRTGKTYGAVDSWGTDRVFVMDSLSGVAIASMGLVAGDKPLRSQAEWGMGMGRVEVMMQHLCFSIPCHVVVTSHIEREQDETTGGSFIMASVPGKKLAPKLPRFFDDVIYCYRKGHEWAWTTNNPSVADLKSRHLGIFEARAQDFVPLLSEWRKAASPAV